MSVPCRAVVCRNEASARVLQSSASTRTCLQKSRYQRHPQATGGTGDDNAAFFKSCACSDTLLRVCMRAWR